MKTLKITEKTYEDLLEFELKLVKKLKHGITHSAAIELAIEKANKLEKIQIGEYKFDD